jgi:hypothetical protein
MKHNKLFFLALLFSFEIINAQTNFRSGYVIRPNNDTLFGEIDYRNDILMANICRFRINEKEPEIVYSPNDIAGYRFKESKYFVSKEVKGKKTFLEFLIKGQVSLYFLKDDLGDHYFIEKEGLGMTEIYFEKGIIEKNGRQYFYKSTRHIGILNIYMQDAPNLKTKIASIGELEHKNLIKLAEDYHNEVCKDESCIIYEKPVPFIKLSVEPLAGYSRFNRKYTDIKRAFEYGTNLLLWLPRSNENLSFKTGLFLASSDSAKMVRVPLQIQYLYPSVRFRPKVSIGTDFYYANFTDFKDLIYVWHLGGGFIYKIKKGAYLSANVSAGFTPFLIGVLIDDFKPGVFVYSFDIGFYFDIK